MNGGSDSRYAGGEFPFGGEPIEPELLAIARRLDHDGGTWRRGLPDEQRVARRVIVALSSAAQTAPAPAPYAPTRTPTRGVPNADQPRRNQPRRRGPRRAQRLLAIAAMLVVVVLLAVVLKAFGPRQAGPHPTATATTAPTATSTPSFPGAWSVAGTFTTPTLPDVAPSDPQVAYYAQLQTPGKTGSTTTTVTLQRTDDAGKTWQALPPPPGLVVDNNLLDVHVVVSADDPRTVYLYSARSAATCGPQGDRGIRTLPLAPSMPQGSGGACLTQYRSGDGGATWTTLALPVPGIIAQVAYDGNGTLYALVAHPLYGSGNTLPDRLIASNDGGLTWHVADTLLWVQGYGIVSMTVAPSIAGTDRNVSVWVITDPVAISQSQQAAPQFQPWRSDDGGATWRLTFSGILPYQYSPVLVAGAGTLYQLAPQAANQGAQTLADVLPAVSTDGGATWTKPPTSGLHPSFSLANAAAVTAGAAIVMPFMDGNDTVFYAWEPGAASWTQVAPPLHQEQAVQLFAVANGGKTTLWAFYGNTLASFTLA